MGFQFLVVVDLGNKVVRFNLFHVGVLVNRMRHACFLRWRNVFLFPHYSSSSILPFSKYSTDKKDEALQKRQKNRRERRGIYVSLCGQFEFFSDFLIFSNTTSPNKEEFISSLQVLFTSAHIPSHR